MSKIGWVIIFGCYLFSAWPVLAQEIDVKAKAGTTEMVEDDADTPVPVSTGRKKKVRVNFEDQLVKGAVANPEVEYIFEKKQFNYRKLIRLRENFVPEAQAGKEEFGAGE